MSPRKKNKIFRFAAKVCPILDRGISPNTSIKKTPKQIAPASLNGRGLNTTNRMVVTNIDKANQSIFKNNAGESPLMRERFSCPLPSVDYQLLFNGLGSGSAGLGSRSHGFFVNHCSHPLSCTLMYPMWQHLRCQF